MWRSRRGSRRLASMRQKADLSFSLAESSGGIDRHVSVETLANSGGSPLVNLIS